jgi:hypothetical protein
MSFKNYYAQKYNIFSKNKTKTNKKCTKSDFLLKIVTILEQSSTKKSAITPHGVIADHENESRMIYKRMII